MKYLPLIWAGLWRKPVRAIFTFLSVAVAFLLFGSLHGITAGLDAVVDWMSPNRMRVQSRASLMDPLPIGYLSQLEQVPHVVNVASVTIFPSYYQDKKEGIGSVAFGGSDPMSTLTSDVAVPKDQAENFLRSPTGALVGAKLAEKYGWKLGDKVPLTSAMWVKRDGTQTWTFDITGIYTIPDQPELAQEFWFHYDYLDLERTQAQGTTNLFILRTDNPVNNAGVAAAVDQLFVNSNNPTLTQNDRDWIRGRLRQIGDIDLMVNAMVGAALFTLLFLTGNTMMQSVRQRIPELAVLKTVGFSDSKVLALVIFEAVALCVVGALLGLALARALFPAMSGAMDIPISMPLTVVGLGVAIATLAAIASAAVPAWRAKRLTVVEALRR